MECGDWDSWGRGTISRNLTLSFSSLWGAVLVAHKVGSSLKTPVPPVQHEVRVQDEPSQLQPTMTISRSQSPLFPVDWKTYTSSGRKLKPPTSSSRPCSELGAGAGVLRETATFLRYRGGTGKGLFLRWSPHSRQRERSLSSASTPARPQVFRTEKASSTFGII